MIYHTFRAWGKPQFARETAKKILRLCPGEDDGWISDPASHQSGGIIFSFGIASDDMDVDLVDQKLRDFTKPGKIEADWHLQQFEGIMRTSVFTFVRGVADLAFDAPLLLDPPETWDIIAAERGDADAAKRLADILSADMSNVWLQVDRGEGREIMRICCIAVRLGQMLMNGTHRISFAPDRSDRAAKNMHRLYDLWRQEVATGQDEHACFEKLIAVAENRELDNVAANPQTAPLSAEERRKRGLTSKGSRTM